MTITNLLSSKTKESITRLVFLLMSLNLIGWEWYAIITKQQVPHIESLLAFLAITLGIKQYNERQPGAIDVATDSK